MCILYLNNYDMIVYQLWNNAFDKLVSNLEAKCADYSKLYEALLICQYKPIIIIIDDRYTSNMLQNMLQYVV